MTREEYGKAIDKAAETFPPDFDSEEWTEALYRARSALIEEWMHTHPGLMEQLKEASSEYKSLTQEEIDKGIIEQFKEKKDG